jgi:DNA mismatch endonuclease, patch repair protein
MRLKTRRDQSKSKNVRRSKAVVSKYMSAIRARDTGPERILRRLLRRLGRRMTLNHGGLAGTPDVVFIRPRVAVFVDGCFWHGCPRCYVRPSVRTDYWSQKLLRNRQRDLRSSRTLRKAGWLVVRIWECTLERMPMKCLQRVRRVLSGAIS